MTYRSILVHVDDTDAWRLRLQTARAMVGDGPLAIQGVYAVCNHNRAKALRGGVTDWHDERSQAACDAFTSAVAEIGADASWHSIKSADPSIISEQLAANAQGADIALLGQWSAELDEHTIPQEVIEQVAIGSGRPVLVLPYITRAAAAPSRAVVAVNGSPASVRALHDAVPLLKDCKAVSLVAFVGAGEDRHAWRWEALKAALEKHNVPVSLNIQRRTEVPVPELLLSRCADAGADLLVMGAHGAYEFPRGLRGSVTRSILRHMTVPVLLSH